MALSLAACGSSKDDTKTPASQETQQTQQDDKKDTPTEEKKEDNGVDVANYSSWKKADWDKASDDQKFEVSEKVVIEIGEEMMEGYAEIYEKAKDSSEKEKLEAEIKNMQSTIDTFFDTDANATLGELVEASKTLMDSSTTK